MSFTTKPSLKTGFSGKALAIAFASKALFAEPAYADEARSAGRPKVELLSEARCDSRETPLKPLKIEQKGAKIIVEACTYRATFNSREDVAQAKARGYITEEDIRAAATPEKLVPTVKITKSEDADSYVLELPMDSSKVSATLPPAVVNACDKGEARKLALEAAKAAITKEQGAETSKKLTNDEVNEAAEDFASKNEEGITSALLSARLESLRNTKYTLSFRLDGEPQTVTSTYTAVKGVKNSAELGKIVVGTAKKDAEKNGKTFAAAPKVEGLDADMLGLALEQIISTAGKIADAETQCK